MHHKPCQILSKYQMVCIALLCFIWHSYNHSVRIYTKKDFKHCHKSKRIWILCDPYLLGECLWPLSSLLPLLWLSVPFAKVGGFSSLIRGILPIWFTDRYCLGIHTCHITNEIKMRMSQGPKCFGHGDLGGEKNSHSHAFLSFLNGQYSFHTPKSPKAQCFNRTLEPLLPPCLASNQKFTRLLYAFVI